MLWVRRGVAKAEASAERWAGGPASCWASHQTVPRNLVQAQESKRIVPGGGRMLSIEPRLQIQMRGSIFALRLWGEPALPILPCRPCRSNRNENKMANSSSDQAEVEWNQATSRRHMATGRGPAFVWIT